MLKFNCFNLKEARIITKKTFCFGTEKKSIDLSEKVKFIAENLSYSNGQLILHGRIRFYSIDEKMIDEVDLPDDYQSKLRNSDLAQLHEPEEFVEFSSTIEVQLENFDSITDSMDSLPEKVFADEILKLPWRSYHFIFN